MDKSTLLQLGKDKNKAIFNQVLAFGMSVFMTPIFLLPLYIHYSYRWIEEEPYSFFGYVVVLLLGWGLINFSFFVVAVVKKRIFTKG